MSYWISVKDRLPEATTKVVVLVRVDNEEYPAFAKFVKDVGWKIEGYNGDWDKNVICWLQLPPPRRTLDSVA
jgi:Protein of unknown function (DUF551)